MLSGMKGTKSGKREEDQIYRWWLEACRDLAYPGTVDDWHYLFHRRGHKKSRFVSASHLS